MEKNITFLCEFSIEPTKDFLVGLEFCEKSKKRIGLELWFEKDFKELIREPFRIQRLRVEKTTKLRKLITRKSLNDAELLTILGNPEPIDVELFIPLLWKMLSFQKDGEVLPDGLETGGYANIFYVRLKNGNIVVCDVRWDDSECSWRLRMLYFDNITRWGPGATVFI